MMMSLDTFIFEIGTLPYQELRRRLDWRFARSDRFGAMPATQFLGPGDEGITLTGALYPGIAGKWSSIETLRDMADKGEPYTLLSGTQEVLGQFVIRGLDVVQNMFLVDGIARRGDFTLELGRTA